MFLQQGIALPCADADRAGNAAGFYGLHRQRGRVESGELWQISDGSSRVRCASELLQRSHERAAVAAVPWQRIDASPTMSASSKKRVRTAMRARPAGVSASRDLALRPGKRRKEGRRDAV